MPRSNLTDIQLFSTDFNGNINWIRTIGGNGGEFSYSVKSDELDAIYVSGYYESDTLYVESSETEVTTIIGNPGQFDLFIAKYTPSGLLEWVRTAGGNGDDRTFRMEYFDEKMYITGYFSDTLKWGGLLWPLKDWEM